MNATTIEQKQQVVATPAEHAGYEDQFNEGYFRLHVENPYETGSKACAAWDAGYQAWRDSGRDERVN